MQPLRRLIHQEMDGLWKCGIVSRAKLYRYLSDNLGYSYHTANIKDVAQATKVLRLIRKFRIRELKKYMDLDTLKDKEK